MTMYPHAHNPIEVRKQQARKYTKNMMISSGVVLMSLFTLAFVSTSVIFMIILIVWGIVALQNYRKLRAVLNHKDN